MSCRHTQSWQKSSGARRLTLNPTEDGVMTQILAIAVIALTSLCGLAFAAEERHAGAWGIFFSDKGLFARNAGSIRSSGEVKIIMGFLCTRGSKKATGGLQVSGDKFATFKITYRLDDAPAVAAEWLSGDLTARTVLPFPGDLDRGGRLAFFCSLPSAGKMSVDVDLDSGPATAVFDLNGIDVVCRTIDDVCKPEN